MMISACATQATKQPLFFGFIEVAGVRPAPRFRQDFDPQRGVAAFFTQLGTINGRGGPAARRLGSHRHELAEVQIEGDPKPPQSPSS